MAAAHEAACHAMSAKNVEQGFLSNARAAEKLRQHLLDQRLHIATSEHLIREPVHTQYDG